jgi:hypothetical protein
MKTPNIELPELAQSESPAYLNFNDGFRALDTVVQLTVSSRAVSTPPDVEQGTRFIVASPATGLWALHEKHVAYKTAAGWSFRIPRVGWLAIVVDESTATNQKMVYFNGVDWIDWAPILSLNDLADIDTDAVDDGDSLVYDAGSETWVPGSPASSLDDLSDVDVTSSPPSDGDALVWSTSLSMWIPGAGGGGSGGGSGDINPDSPPTLPDATDDEFAVGTTLDTTGSRFSGATAWAWRNQGGATALYKDGAVVLAGPGGTSTNLRVIELPVSGSVWVYRAKLRDFITTNTADFSLGGMCVVNNTSGRVISIHEVMHTGTRKLECNRWNSATSYNSTAAGPTDIYAATARTTHEPLYMEIENDGTNIYFRYSDSGVTGTFITFRTEPLATFITSVDKVGLLVNNDTGSNAPTLITDWFRKITNPGVPPSGGAGGSDAPASPDTFPLAPSIIDDEFETAALNTKWLWRNQGSGTAVLKDGSVILKSPAASGDDWRQIYQVIASPGAAYDMRAKAAISIIGGFNYAGLSLQLAGGKFIVFGMQGLNLTIAGYNNDTTYGGYLPYQNNLSTTYGTGWVPKYYRITFDGTSTWKFWVSLWGVDDNDAWRELLSTNINSGFLSGNPDRIGLAVNASDVTSPGIMVCDWFRSY